MLAEIYLKFFFNINKLNCFVLIHFSFKKHIQFKNFYTNKNEILYLGVFDNYLYSRSLYKLDKLNLTKLRRLMNHFKSIIVLKKQKVFIDYTLHISI